MGFLSKLFGSKDDDSANTFASHVAEGTPVSSAPKTVVIDMSKSKENLNKVLIDMSKGAKIDMTKHTARVALAMDYSGSMSNLYDNG